MIMLVQDILLDDLKNGDGNGRGGRRKPNPTHVVGVVRCAQSVKVTCSASTTLS